MKRNLLWPGSMQSSVFQSQLAHPWSSSSDSPQENRERDLQSQHHPVHSPALSFPQNLELPQEEGGAAPTPQVPAGQGMELSCSFRELQHVCTSLTEHCCLHSHCGKGWQWSLIPCSTRELGLFFPVIPGQTIEQVQPQPAVQRKGGSEAVCHRLLHFLPSSIKESLPALLSIFLLSCLASECFTPPAPSLWVLMRLCVSPQVGNLGFQVQRFPAPQTPRDHSILFPERATLGLSKSAPKIYTHGQKHNPCAAGGEQHHQTHIFLMKERLRKEICFWNATSLSSQRPAVIKDKQQLRCILFYLQHWKLQFSFAEGEQCVSFQ